MKALDKYSKPLTAVLIILAVSGVVMLSIPQTLAPGGSMPEGFALGKVEVAAENSYTVQYTGQSVWKAKSIGSVFVGTSEFRRMCYWVNMQAELRVVTTGTYADPRMWVAIHTSDHPAGETTSDFSSLTDLVNSWPLYNIGESYGWQDKDELYEDFVGIDTPVYLVVWIGGGAWGDDFGCITYCRNAKAHLLVFSYVTPLAVWCMSILPQAQRSTLPRYSA